jgi:ArsR family transcriptional regulator
MAPTIIGDRRTLLRLRAIADERRFRILSLLAGGERCVCDLQDILDIGQSLLSFHLRTLKDAGLVTDRREGRWIYYALRPDGLEEIEEFLRDLRSRADATPVPARPCR